MRRLAKLHTIRHNWLQVLLVAGVVETELVVDTVDDNVVRLADPATDGDIYPEFSCHLWWDHGIDNGADSHLLHPLASAIDTRSPDSAGVCPLYLVHEASLLLAGGHRDWHVDGIGLRGDGEEDEECPLDGILGTVALRFAVVGFILLYLDGEVVVDTFFTLRGQKV